MGRGTVAARTLVRATPTPGDTTRTGTSLGELAFGQGVVRIAGSLLPDPTEENFHPYGLASYALTYTGYQVFENLVDWDNPNREEVDDGEPASATSGSPPSRSSSSPARPHAPGSPRVRPAERALRHDQIFKQSLTTACGSEHDGRHG